MVEALETHVPDIGDFKDVEVVEILVKDGDRVVQEQPLITVETDKATMEVPSPHAGQIASVALKVGDRVSRGTLIAVIVQTEGEGANAASSSRAALAAHDAPAATSSDRDRAPVDFDLAVIGSGPGGYSAAFRAADLGLKVVLVERYDVLGGVCLNVGCIPSKAFLHVAAVKEEAQRLAAHGVRFGEPFIDLQGLRSYKAATVKRLTDGLSRMAAARKVEVVNGYATFASAHCLQVVSGDGPVRTISFRNCVIATGSTATRLPFLPEDRRIVTSTGALRLDNIPRSMLVVGGGIIGLEMATVYSALGARIDIIEKLPNILAGVDPEAIRIWRKQNGHRFDRIMLGASIQHVVAEHDGISVTVSGTNDSQTLSYDLVLQAAGRVPNTKNLNLENIGLAPDARGFLAVDTQMRTQVPHIFAIGDVVGGPMLAHKAVHEGHVAAEAIAGLQAHFDATVVPNVAYTDPEIAWVGLSEQGERPNDRKLRSTVFPWAASGRAIACDASYGMTKLTFDEATNRVVGGVIVGPHAGDLIGEVCLAIEMGADALDIGKTIHPHPTLGESIGMAADVYERVCTDLLPDMSRRTA